MTSDSDLVQPIALREAEQRMRLFIESIRDYAIFMLDINGYVSLMSMLGGGVTAASDGVGRGSTFAIELPIVSGDARATSPGSGGLAPIAAEQARRIIVVDDNVDAAELLAELLRMLGHRVDVAHDGPSALAVVRRFTPQIAILDVGLPGMNGHELASRIRAELGDTCRLIALTGYGQDADRERSSAAGFDEHLVKPIDVGQVSRLIERCDAKR